MEADEPGLVARAAAGEGDAFAELCDRHRGRMWRIVCSVAAGPDAEDLAQEAVLRAWTSIRRYRREAPFAAWLCRIALNAAHDYQRSSWQRRIRFPGSLPEIVDDRQPDPDSEAVRRERVRRVRREVAALPAALREPVWLHYFERFTLDEVSRLTGEPQSTVRSRLRTGLKRLSHALADLEQSDYEPAAAAGAQRCES